MSSVELSDPVEAGQVPPDQQDIQSTETNSSIRDGRGIANAALLVMVCYVLSRVTGLGREIVIGAQFGTSGLLDAYLAAFRVPDILFQLIAGGALGSAFIPTFSGYWVKGDRPGAWLLFSRVLNLVTLVLVVLAALAAIFALPLVHYVIAPGFVPGQQALTADLMRWMLISAVLFGASGLVMGALNATQHFLLPAIAPIIYNLAIIVGAWLLAPLIGVYGLVVGVVAGALGHLLVQLPGLIRRHARYTFSWTVRDPGVTEVARLMGPRVLGLCFVQLHFLVNTILASSLAPGSLSTRLTTHGCSCSSRLGYSPRPWVLPPFPTFAAQIASGRPDAMRQTFSQILRTVFFLTIPAAVGLYLLREPVISALLERGRFGRDSTLMVAYALQFYALGLVSHAAVEIIVRAILCLAQYTDAGRGRHRRHGAQRSAELMVGGLALLRRAGVGQHSGDDSGNGGVALAPAQSHERSAGPEACAHARAQYCRSRHYGCDNTVVAGSAGKQRLGILLARIGRLGYCSGRDCPSRRCLSTVQFLVQERRIASSTRHDSLSPATDECGRRKRERRMRND